MRKPSPLVPPLKKPASTSLLDRRAFLVGAGVAGVACGAAIDVAYTQIVTAADSFATHRAAKARARSRPVISATFGETARFARPEMHLRAGRRVASSAVTTRLDDVFDWHGFTSRLGRWRF